MAAVVVAVPAEFVNTARYLLPFCASTTLKLSVVLVAPLRFVNVVPPFVLTCHCTVGFGVPLAAAVKETSKPFVTAWATGFNVTTGAWELPRLNVTVTDDWAEFRVTEHAPEPVQAPPHAVNVEPTDGVAVSATLDP